MPGVRNRGEMIRQFIIENVDSHPNDIVTLTSENFNISRQAVNAHLKKLISQKSITTDGKTRNISYKLHPLIEDTIIFKINGLEEDRVWRDDVKPKLAPLPDNIIDIWNYGFTEMLNNAIDHSQGSHVIINH